MDTIKLTLASMDQIKVVLAQIPENALPKGFWYGLTVILLCILVWIIQRYFASLQTVIAEFRENIGELKTICKELTIIAKSHEEELKEHREDIKTLYRDRHC